MEIAIRADGGLYIGMGHIMRTLVLAEELSKKNKVFYVCRKSNSESRKYEPGINMIKRNGFDVVNIDEFKFLEELLKIKADCLITDSYDVSEDYFNITKKHFKYTGYIDDMNLYYFNVDFIINQNIGSESYIYKSNKFTYKMLGSDYTMLRKEFRVNRDIKINRHVSDIMITVGGSDENNITAKLLNYIKKLKYNFHIIIGPSFMDEYVSQLKLIEKSRKNIKLYINANVVDVMKKCDLCISSCGSTLYELASCGIPTLGIVIAENQRKIADKMDSLGLIKNLGNIKTLDSNMLCSAIIEINKNFDKRRTMSKKLRSFVDGNGAQRIANMINEKLILY